MTGAQITFWLGRARSRQAQLQAAQLAWQQQITDFNWQSVAPLVVFQNALKDVDRQLSETQAVLATLEDLAADAVERGLLDISALD